ncbi:MAG: GTP 3',8-cyclase MoaA [Nitrososphaerota archaeon]|nr:GTP 3',8-cyclase MoaA [Nitrososphaerota archaeon]MDG7040060.1 GTP 3',8-cyclase MoaA [Nitrososphaerota archaeon]MDG7046160.1 GTP 3',8-cyclase MoaA [Nitrososphaerota archaeon]MDG7047880.1 GTP 3',8-cyclase MoaA [Nitrososphaerota archaeon]
MESSKLVDSFNRRTTKVRISVTDKCNFACFFCMPIDPIWMPRADVLTYEEIVRVVKVLKHLGINEVKLTGGEPLVRKDIEVLVNEISQVIEDISMTTNGFFLNEKARLLHENGLRRVTVSLHSLRRERFKFITNVDALERVITGIRAAKDAGLSPVKINSTIIRGRNDDEILDLLEFAIREGVSIRYIEFMPFDGKNFWSLDKVIAGAEIKNTIESRYKLIELPRGVGSTSSNYMIKGTDTTVGFITSVTQPFCSDCDRIRIMANGSLVPCMFGNMEFDFRHLLREGASDDDLEKFFIDKVGNKFAGVETMVHEKAIPSHIRPMYTIGG